MRIDYESPLPVSIASILFAFGATYGVYYYFSQVVGTLVVEGAVYGVYFGWALATWLFGYFTQREFQVYDPDENPAFRLLLLGPGSIILAFLPPFMIYYHRYVVAWFAPESSVWSTANQNFVSYLETELLPFWYDAGELLAPYGFLLSVYVLSTLLFEIGRKASPTLYGDREEA
jgi:hypothetical protein